MVSAFLVFLFLVFAASGGASAQEEEKKLGWADQAELALVVTAGNSETSTFGFRNVLSRIWEKAEFHFEAAGLRTETTTISRTPIGESFDDFEVREDRESMLTAENYLARAKYDRQVASRFFVYGSGGWERNEFAGVRNRYSGAGGVGNIWADREIMKWRTDYGLSVTNEEPTVGSSDTFAGLRVSSDFLRKLTSSTTVTNLTILDENLEETDDLRLDSTTAVAVSIAQHLALKVSLKFLFDNVPSFVETELVSPATGVPIGIPVPVQADKLDTFFNVALVINF